jgi:hypothetical protein
VAHAFENRLQREADQEIVIDNEDACHDILLALAPRLQFIGAYPYRRTHVPARICVRKMQ